MSKCLCRQNLATRNTYMKLKCSICFGSKVMAKVKFLGHRSHRLQWPIVITRCPSSVCRPLDNLHFQLLLQNRLIDFDETWSMLLIKSDLKWCMHLSRSLFSYWYGWSTQVPLQVLLFFGQIRPGADPGRAKIGHGGSPSSKNFFFRLEGYSNKPNA